MHQDIKKCEIGDELTEQSRFVEFAWESVTEALRDKTCLRSPFVLSAGAHQTVFPKATFSQQTRPDAHFRAEAAAAMSRLRPC